ncbi:helix-turn-helix transcriptional regulator [Pseudomaricurvus alkylphenolicus]|uniref:helix-turn-helix transcriptional regulator n=1 Tax=Pseudomaricurvus alkylphenolicus TaxID=1306991 RepID=UPI0014232B14|nr:AraC family transcriptional regulator [Pseudomaricurvus alkylphenolicus]NIB39011.1 helix-turn-helix transcriptional regulator [Pseudomaricurvus alkylphenolicus]
MFGNTTLNADITDVAKRCESSLIVRRRGALTDIYLSDDVLSDSPLFDGDFGNVNVSLLLDLLEHLQQQGKISRLVRYHERGEGARCYHQIGPGLLMCLFNQEIVPARSFASFWLDGWALLKINVHGNIAFRIGDDLLELNQAAGMITYGGSAPINKSVCSEEPETGITLLFSPQSLYENLDVHHNDFLNLLGKGVGAEDSVTQLFPIDGKLVNLVHQLLELDVDDFLYFLEVEALTKNVLLQSLKLLRGQAAEGGTTHKLKNQDIEKLNTVKSLLESDYSQVFTLDDLGRQVGLNRRKLTEGFKGLFGDTVSEYLLRQRMINAADMLRQGRSVTEAAHHVGYKEQSSLTRAFKRYYGILPKDFCV